MAPGALEIAAEAAFGVWALAASVVAIATNDGRRRSLAVASALAASGALSVVGGSPVTGVALLALSGASAALAPAPLHIPPSSRLALALAVPLAALLAGVAIHAVPSVPAPTGELVAELYGRAPLALIAAGLALLVALVAVAARPSGEAR